MQKRAPLNDGQRELVEDNLGLVHWAIKQMRTRIDACGMGTEDAYQIGCLAMCKAARTWDGSKAAFSSYAGVSMLRHIARYCTHGTDRARGARSVFGANRNGLTICALDAPINPGEGSEARTYGDVLMAMGECVPYDDSLIGQEMIDMLGCLGPVDRHVMERRIAEASYEQIGREMGVSRERIRQRVVKSRKELAKRMGIEAGEKRSKG